ncbi:uncharacterized protein LOC114943596 [Nylanderia fulva]|uniref:uncharacterized protein LOC114928967 n=1 Tax=Nylanderia fulva TaxID=613905 RepID=UPI0010FB8E90|nr:uncharacterized protein LOC114928967 [Nylanderia fulva]XP_029156172.1 uncharacterized protein LOC114928967 [Nylanderia fulva]XP_029173709.1 uncharacterized protein LOC114942501 [Nylanderia fulva]XP_029173710.1 uncharacterized protein LOC114942501 [Nylanderia fulva]XP_029175084.1 uncharacterized protein LOC114943596 [Nylanderia fulva]
MEKLRFDFMVRGSTDGKSNILCLTSIGTPDDRSFGFPEEYQPAHLHTELTKTQIFAKVKNSLKKRHQSRKVWIGLSETLTKVYLDEEENLQFGDYYLEEITEKKTTTASEPSSSEEIMRKILEKLMEEKQQKSEIKNLGKIAQDFMLEKFTGKTSNAHQWINEFERECERFEINEDRKKIETLKFFLEKACVDWYSCMLIKFTVQSEWKEWKKNFCETFANKGWIPIRYALSFKFQSGPLLDYAIKKEKLLLEVRKSIDTGTLIDLIAAGLPNFISDRIDRETLNETEDLYNELGKLEHLVNKNRFEIKKNKTDNIKEKTPCKICKDNNKGTRYHPESACWFKDKENKIKNVNNAVLEMELNCNEQKN